MRMRPLSSKRVVLLQAPGPWGVGAGCEPAPEKPQTLASQGPHPPPRLPSPESPSPSQALAWPLRALPSWPDRLVSRRPEHLHSGHRRAVAPPGPAGQQGSVRDRK